MQLYMNDKALEFNSEYKKLERILEILKATYIDVSEESKEIVALKKQIDYDVLNVSSTDGIETIYSQGLKKLREINICLKKHEVYYDVYTAATNIESKLNGDVGEKQLKYFAQIIISLLQKINSSDTRVFEHEEKIIDKVYDVAYSIIKLELLKSGQSEVLTWAKCDRTTANFIDIRVFADIAKNSENSPFYEQIREMFANINSQNSNDNSYLNYTALNEELILFLALQEGDNFKKIEAYLLSIIKKLEKNQQEMYRQEFEIERKQSMLAAFEKKIKGAKLYKQAALSLCLIALILNANHVSDKIAKHLGHYEFRTRLDYYSSSDTIEMPDYSEFMEKIDNYSQTILKAYDTWHRENIFFGDYQRDVVTFDLSDVDLENLADYESIDFSQLPMLKKVETVEELDASMLYDEAIIEITRFIQDPDDTIFVPSGDNEFFKVVFSIFLCLCSGIELVIVLSKSIKNIRTILENEPHRKECLEFLKEGLEKYKMLTEKNEEFKKKFLECYQKYAAIISDDKVKKACKTTLQRIKK